MRTILHISICLGLFAGQVWAQQPDSIRIVKADSVRADVRAVSDSVQAIHEFLNAHGPAEAVFSFFSPPPYRFKSGVYSVVRPDFPLLNSPDSLVQLPVRRAYRQSRRARISALASAVPLAIFTYSVTGLVLSLGSILTRQPPILGVPNGDVLKISGIGVVAGTVVTATFNIALLFNLQKGIKRHNSWFGRKMPTIFNPKGL